MRWHALKSKKFSDIIVRETMEVASHTLRRIQPGDICIQRGQTMQMENGLVRMQIEPDGGWVTVHARNIQGPTFLEEADQQRPPPSPDMRAQQSQQSQQRPPAQQQQQQQPPRLPAQNEYELRTDQGKGQRPDEPSSAAAREKGAPPAKASGREQQWQEKAPQPPPPKGKSAGPIGAAPWQDGEDPWSNNVDPWAKGGAVDPWAVGAARGPPGKGDDKGKGKGKDKGPPRQGNWPGASYGQPPPPSGPESTISYDRMKILLVRSTLLDSKAIEVAPSSIANIRTLKIPNMEPAARVKKTDRPDRERRREAREKEEQENEGGGSFLRDRDNATARDSPVREARSGAAADSVQRAAPAQPTASAEDAGTTPAAPAADETKAKESKGNCPTQ